MKDPNIVTLTEMMDAVNQADAKRYAKLYPQNAVITIYGGDTLNGREEIEQYENKLFRDFPATHLAFYSAWKNADMVAVHYGVNSPNPGGKSTGHEGLLFFWFGLSGLIQEEHRYLDSLTPMAQLGMIGSRSARPLPKLPNEMKIYFVKGSPLESKNRALVRDSLAALNSKNETAFMSTLADQVRLDEMIDPRPVVGKEDVGTWFRNWRCGFPDADAEITKILGVGDFVLVEVVLRGNKNGPIGYLNASSKKFEVHRSAILQIRDYKLIKITNFMNTKELAMSVGQWPLMNLR